MQWRGCRGWEPLGVGAREWLCPWTRQAAGVWQEVIRGAVCGQGPHLCFLLTELPALLAPRTMVHPAAPVGTSCSSFTSHSRCTKTVSINSAYSYPATKHKDTALCSISLRRLKGWVWDWVGCFGGVGAWVPLPFLVIYLFKRRKTQQTGRQLLQVYNPENSVLVLQTQAITI